MLLSIFFQITRLSKDEETIMLLLVISLTHSSRIPGLSDYLALVVKRTWQQFEPLEQQLSFLSHLLA